MRDQDYMLIRSMAAAANVNSIVNKWDNLKGKQIHSLRTSERRLLRMLRDWGLL